MGALDRLILEHRGMMRDELNFPPSQSRPPVAYRWDEVERAMVPDDSPLVINPLTPEQIEVPDSATHSTQIGVPISSRLMRYVTGPTPDTPWASALVRLRAECRRIHPYHRASDRPYWRGSLCHQLVIYTVIRRFSVENAGKILRYDNPEPVLRFAFGFIESSIDDARRRAERRAREDEGHGPGAVPRPVAEHHAVPGLHSVECPQCRRGAA